MKPVENYRKLLRYTRMCAGYCGADIFDENYKVSFLTLIVFCCIFSYFGFTIYTCKISSDWTVILEVLCMAGSVVQGLAKLISGIIYTKDFVKIKNCLDDIYEKYVKIGKKYERVLEISVKRLEIFWKITIFSYLIAFVIMVFVPFTFLIFNAKRIFVMQFLIPGLNPNTDTGYFSTLFIQYFYFGFGAIGNAAGDLVVILLIVHFIMIKDILKLKVDDLNEILSKKNSEFVISQKLRDLAVWHQEYINYKTSVQKMIFWLVFFQVTTSAFSMTLTLFVIVAGYWPAAYAYFTLNFSILVIYGCLGTVVEITNDKIIDAISEISWYLLKTKQRKNVQIMLVNAQIQDVISVGGLAPLSANTVVQVLKTIYSYWMFITNFLDA